MYDRIPPSDSSICCIWHPTDKVYVNKPYFKFLKNRWATNFDELDRHYLKIHLRNNETGNFQRKFEQYPTSYRLVKKDIKLIVNNMFVYK